jgi:hypothetical protein
MSPRLTQDELLGMEPDMDVPKFGEYDDIFKLFEDPDEKN